MKPIWIVDDDHSIRFVLEKALAREGLAVRSFTNTRDVLSALDGDVPQVMVSDIRMPGESGLVLLNKVKCKINSMLLNHNLMLSSCILSSKQIFSVHKYAVWLQSLRKCKRSQAVQPALRTQLRLCLSWRPACIRTKV
jgi:CheY-like chemotaxis protein